MAEGRIHERARVIKNRKPNHNRILIGTATRGTIRIEWAAARFGQIIPTNWMATNTSVGFSSSYPIGYLVDDAQNIIVRTAVEHNFEWLLLVEDDVVLPPDAFLRFNRYMLKGNVPVVSGLYFLKSQPTEPLVYRGRGNGPYEDFKAGELVWADGVPTGCLLIHGSILKLMWDDSEEYQTPSGNQVRRVFETPRKVSFDPETYSINQAQGTSDLYWCDRVMREGYLHKAGWKGIGRRKYPFLVDTNITCGHIDITSGQVYPLGGFMRRK